MFSPDTLAKLERHLVGRTLPPLRAAVSGAVLAAIAFFLFEWASVLNSNIPRIPVAWLLAVMLPLIEGIMYLRLRGIIKYPRSHDFLFVLRINFAQRRELASRIQRRSTVSFLAFSGAAALVALFGEFFVIRERSLPALLGVPFFLVAIVAIMGYVYELLLRSAFVKPSQKDSVKVAGGVLGGTAFGHLRSSMVQAGVIVAGRLTPGSVRALVKRNAIYLLRGEPLLLLSATIGAPLFLVLLLLLIHDAPAGFDALFAVLGVIIINSVHGTIVQESADQLARCPYYAPPLRKVIQSTMYSAMLLSLPVAITFVVFALVKYPLANAASLLLSFGMGLAAILFYLGTLVVYPSRIYGEHFNDWLLCALIGIGMFVPWLGWLFPLAVIIVVALFEIDALKFKGSFAGYRSVETET